MTALGDMPVRLLEQFAVAVGGGALDVRFERRNQDDAFAGRYVATLELATFLPVTIDRLALTHATHPEEFMRDYARERLEPWRMKLVRAGGKAIDAWQDELA